MQTKICIIAMMLCMNQVFNTCVAQNDDIKSFLFLSVFCDWSDYWINQASNIIEDFQNDYDKFSYECTRPLEIPVDTLYFDSLLSYEKYTIQLFKIQRNPKLPTYYILRVVGCDTYKFNFRDQLWIRISGYRESDLKVFFDALRQQGLKKRDLKFMIEQWCNSDEMFREIDWDCLLKGYFKNDTRSDCYISNSNIVYKLQYLGEKDDIYATFSKKILAGCLYKY